MCTQSYYDIRVANQHNKGQSKPVRTGDGLSHQWSQHAEDRKEQELIDERRPSQLRMAEGMVTAALHAEGQASRGESNVGSGSDEGPSGTDAEGNSTLKAGVPRYLAHLHNGGRTSERGGPSKFRGVVWHKSNSKWEARIYEGGKQKFLGYFTNENAAAMAYDDYAIRVHGNIQKLNFPDRYAGVPLPPLNPQATTKMNSGNGGGNNNGHINNNNNSTDQNSQRDAHFKDHAAVNAGDNVHNSMKAPRRSALRVQPVKGSSRFRGVSWNSNCGKWRAQVWKGSEVHHLGYFEHEEDAARAYDEAALRIRGPDAPINFSRSEYGMYTDNEDEEEKYYDRRSSVRSRKLGVSWTRGGWLAEIWDGEQYRNLGVYPTELEAAEAYDIACLERHGADALTNFPLGRYDAELAAVALRELSTDPEGLEGLSETSSDDQEDQPQPRHIVEHQSHDLDHGGSGSAGGGHSTSFPNHLVRPKAIKLEVGMPFVEHARFVDVRMSKASSTTNVAQHMASKLHHAFLRQQRPPPDTNYSDTRNNIWFKNDEKGAKSLAECRRVKLSSPSTAMSSAEMERALSSLVNLVQARHAEAKRERQMMCNANQITPPTARSEFWNYPATGTMNGYYQEHGHHPQMVMNEFVKRSMHVPSYDQAAAYNSAVNSWVASSSKRARLW